jgi:hypothetical protein
VLVGVSVGLAVSAGVVTVASTVGVDVGVLVSVGVGVGAFRSTKSSWALPLVSVTTMHNGYVGSTYWLDPPVLRSARGSAIRSTGVPTPPGGLATGTSQTV